MISEFQKVSHCFRVSKKGTQHDVASLLFCYLKHIRQIKNVYELDAKRYLLTNQISMKF